MDTLMTLLLLIAPTVNTVRCLEAPEQVHLSYGDTADQMVVMWSTKDDVKTTVHYGQTPDTLNEQEDIEMSRLTENSGNCFQFIHRATLKDLTSKTKYFYKVSSHDGHTRSYTTVFSFTTMDTNTARTASFLVYGDVGVQALDTMSSLQTEVASGRYDCVWHLGDFAYDMHSDGGQVGDQFMREIENISANVPYMTLPGNHEITWSQGFHHYRTRFSNPGTPWPIPVDAMWYSYDIGPVHFISYSTEVYFTSNQNYVCSQFYWLLQDLEKANQNRASRPWIVAMGHRPMYCSNSDIDDCTNRIFSGWVRRGLEDLFHTQGVDLILEAHEHSYERLFPLRHGKLVAKNYSNLTTSIHIISGSGGNKEGSNPMPDKTESWSAFRHSIDGDNTYGHLVVHNATHLYWDQARSSNGEVIDHVWLVQHHHGPFVTNSNCSSDRSQPWCRCPSPFHYVTVAVCILLPLIVLLTCTCVICCMWKRKRRKRDNSYKMLTTAEEGDDESLLET